MKVIPTESLTVNAREDDIEVLLDLSAVRGDQSAYEAKIEDTVRYWIMSHPGALFAMFKTIYYIGVMRIVATVVEDQQHFDELVKMSSGDDGVCTFQPFIVAKWDSGWSAEGVG